MRTVVTLAALTWLLITAESILRPFATALLLALVLSATAERIARLVPARSRRGKTVARLVGIVGITMAVVVVAVLLGEALADLAQNIDVYGANLDLLLSELQALTGISQTLTVSSLVQRIDLQAFAIDLATLTAAFGSLLFIVILYVVFIFVEAQAFDDKLKALADTAATERRLQTIAAEIKRAIDDVLGVQVLVGLVQAVPTFIVLSLVGVDAAVLWSVLAFLMSFIPTIGTVFGIAIPSLMTLLQFMSLPPFLIVLVATSVAQLYGTNILLPRLMSRSLNVSSLAVLLAVVAGGTLWGIVGAVIAVPVLTIAMIVCAKLPRLRPVAVLISADGELPAEALPPASEAPPASDREGR